MNTKEPRDKKEARARKEESFQEPTTKDADHEAEYEDAPVESFAEPKVGDEYTEDAAAAASYSTTAGIPQQLLEIKQQIEDGMAKTAASGAVSVEEAMQGAANIVGVGIGYGETHPSPGTPTLSSDIGPGEHALNVYVAELTSIDEVKSVIVESLGAAAASEDGLPINIIQTGLIQAQPHAFRIRPAPGGVSIGHPRVTAGTLGCLSTGNRAPRNSRLLILSNNHVIANSNNAAYGDCIAQPGYYDGGRCPADQIAILERFVPINFSGGANYVDAATGWAWPDRVRRELVYRSGSGLAFFRIASTPVAPALGMIVGKTGRTTQLTVGRVTGVGVTVNVSYGGGRVARFFDQIAIQSVNSSPFSAGGDSGSSIWTWNATRNPVGLLFAGGGGVTFANRMTRVLAALDIRLYT